MCDSGCKRPSYIIVYWFLPKPFSLSNVPTTIVKLKQIIFFRVELTDKTLKS